MELVIHDTLYRRNGMDCTLSFVGRISVCESFGDALMLDTHACTYTDKAATQFRFRLAGEAEYELITVAG